MQYECNGLLKIPTFAPGLWKAKERKIFTLAGILRETRTSMHTFTKI